MGGIPVLGLSVPLSTKLMEMRSSQDSNSMDPGSLAHCSISGRIPHLKISVFDFKKCDLYLVMGTKPILTPHHCLCLLKLISQQGGLCLLEWSYWGVCIDAATHPYSHCVSGARGHHALHMGDGLCLCPLGLCHCLWVSSREQKLPHILLGPKYLGLFIGYLACL